MATIRVKVKYVVFTGPSKGIQFERLDTGFQRVGIFQSANLDDIVIPLDVHTAIHLGLVSLDELNLSPGVRAAYHMLMEGE